jgi:lipopolysaccharide transport system ATP-binding protein
MEDTMIKFEDVSKKFVKNLRKSMYYGVKDVAKNIFGIPARTEILRNDEFWALDNVSFELKKGKTLGVIGPNGAGKTTILKLIAGILYPDKGKVEVDGKVGSLIEIGAGFHPNLTGRENIYVNGAILGMSKKEIDRKINDIIEFADIGDFINSPVKYYSAGMYVRLGFSIAVHSEPDILLVDEVLAVGDEEFQMKCVKKIKEMLKKNISLVLVSHNLTLVGGMCEEVILLSNGKVIKKGKPEEVISYYISSLEKETKNISYTSYGPILLTKEAEIIESKILNEKGEEIYTVNSGEEVVFSFKVKFNEKVENPIFAIHIKNDIGEEVYGTNTNLKYIKTGSFEKGETVIVYFKQKIMLINGNYSVMFGVAYQDGLTFCEWKERSLNFKVVLKENLYGFLNLNSEIIINRNVE